MTQEEKDRLEIAKEMCSLQDCTLNEIYAFIKGGNTAPATVALDNTPADGIWIIFDDGNCVLYDSVAGGGLNTDHIVAVGIKQGNRSIAVALHDAAGGEDVTLTTADGEEDYLYCTEYIDAVADWDGEGNTEHLKANHLNPAIDLKPGQWIPSVAEMYLIYTHRRELNKALQVAGGEPIKGIWYWTSTESSATNAWGLYLSDGLLNYWLTKASNKGRVRPVSAFIL